MLAADVPLSMSVCNLVWYCSGQESKSDVCESSFVGDSSFSLISTMVCSLNVGQDSLCVLMEVSPKCRDSQLGQHRYHPIDSSVLSGVLLRRSLWIPNPCFSMVVQKLCRSSSAMSSSIPVLYNGHCSILQLVGMLRWV